MTNKNILQKEIILNGKPILYTLEFKKVKNINLRIKNDMSINVSAPKGISPVIIEQFIFKKADFILGALEKYSAPKKAVTPYFTEDELKKEILEMSKELYPYFSHVLKEFPRISFRKMKTCWGSCRPTKGALTFNTNLIYVPKECVRYVVCHEFTHFIQPNHSKLFYNELEKISPNWRSLRAILKNTNCI